MLTIDMSIMKVWVFLVACNLIAYIEPSGCSVISTTETQHRDSILGESNPVGKTFPEMLPTQSNKHNEMGQQPNTSTDTTVESSNIGQSKNSDISIVSTLTLKLSYVVVGAIGIIGNTFVIIVIFYTKQMRKALTNIFILNQSYIDVLVSTFVVFNGFLEDPNAMPPGLAQEIYCRLWVREVLCGDFLIAPL